MSRIIYARLDEKTEKLLTDVKRRLGWIDSEAMRAGVKMMVSVLVGGRARKVVGPGCFRFIVPELGSKKDHLKGFSR